MCIDRERLFGSLYEVLIARFLSTDTSQRSKKEGSYGRGLQFNDNQNATLV